MLSCDPNIAVSVHSNTPRGLLSSEYFRKTSLAKMLIREGRKTKARTTKANNLAVKGGKWHE